MNPSKIGYYLSRNHKIRIRSSLDVRHMAKVTGSVVGILKAMCEIHLGSYFAEWKVPSSWTNDIFKDKELEFAARDSHQTIELFKFFHLKFIQNSSLEGISNSALSIVKEYLNKNYEEARASNFKYARNNRNRNRNRNDKKYE